MTNIKVTNIDNGYMLDCLSDDGVIFNMKINNQGELIEKPKHFGLEESMAYFHIKHKIENHEPILEREVSAWG